MIALIELLTPGLPLARGDAAGIIIVPIVLIFFGAIIAFSIHANKKARERWMGFAAHYGLHATAGGFGSASHMSGWFDGVYVHIGTVTRGSGKNRHTYTQFQAMIEGALPYGLQVYQENFGSKVGKFFGGQDIQIGDQQLDNSFIFKGNDPGQVQHFVTQPLVREALFRLVSQQPGFVLDSGRVMIELNGWCSDPARMYSATIAAVHAVQAIHAVLGVIRPAVVPAPEPIALPIVAAPAQAAAPVAPKPGVTKARVAMSGPRPDNTPRGDGGTLAMLDKLSDASLMSNERDAMVQKLGSDRITISVVIDRVELTSAFDVPEGLKDGRTVLGNVNGLRTKVAARFAGIMNPELVKLKRGESLTVQGRVAGWDGLYDRVNIDVA